MPPLQTFFTTNGIYLLLPHYRGLGHLDIAHLLGLQNLSSHLPNFKYSTFLTEVENQIVEFAFRLDEQIRLLHCQLERVLGIASTTIGLLFPILILFLALDKPCFGILSDDT